MKRCLFCKADSSASRSVEHIIPESLGNTTAVLPPGVVCDTCNNYFARKVEAPFLQSPAVLHLRFHQRLENKRGRVPSVLGFIRPDIPASITFCTRTETNFVEVPQAAFRELANAKRGELILPLGGSPPSSNVISRFMAKVALEAMAARLTAYTEGVAYLCDEVQLDEIREHARLGRTERWPVHIRRLYPAEGMVLSPEGRAEQVVHEFDFLMTPANEWYFILAIFGMEFTINMGGPDVEGYQRWLDGNGGVSPLYSGKNGTPYEMPR